MCDDDWTDGPNPRRWLVVSHDLWDPFLRFRESIHKALVKSALWESVKIASKEYLRARFADCPDAKGRELEDCTMHYVVALEKLLTEERNGNSRQVKFRAALAAADDGERPKVVAAFKDDKQVKPPLVETLERAYRYRNRIVHAGKPEIDAIAKDLPIIRDICRRAFAGILLATEKFADEVQFGDYRRSLLSSQSSQELARHFAKQVLELSGSEPSE